MEKIRLQKFLAMSGMASRRKAEELIKQGKVKVDGEIVSEMGLKVDNKNTVEVDGKIISMNSDMIYIMLNKPSGYVTTVKDQFGRPAVIDLVKGVEQRIYPVGRLDYDTKGLLILTNDGDFTYKLTHPSHNIGKEYIAEVMGIPGKIELDRLRMGVFIDGYMTSQANVRILDKKGKMSIISIIIHEGRNRQIRKMFDTIGYPVISLKRIAIGSLKLGDLAESKWRRMEPDEVSGLLDENRGVNC